jgi:hypothetical protein
MPRLLFGGADRALRKAFGADRDLIRTVAGRGHQFTGEIRVLPASDGKREVPGLSRPRRSRLASQRDSYSAGNLVLQFKQIARVAIQAVSLRDVLQRVGGALKIAAASSHSTRMYCWPRTSASYFKPGMLCSATDQYPTS